MQELKKNQHLQEYIRLLESRLHQTDLHQWTRGTQVSLHNQSDHRFTVAIIHVCLLTFWLTFSLLEDPRYEWHLRLSATPAVLETFPGCTVYCVTRHKVEPQTGCYGNGDPVWPGERGSGSERTAGGAAVSGALTWSEHPKTTKTVLNRPVVLWLMM